MHTKDPLDLVTARAVHLAISPDFDRTAAARELVHVAQGRRPLLTAALIRVDHALTARWSLVAWRASEALRAAIDVVDRQPAAA